MPMERFNRRDRSRSPDPTAVNITFLERTLRRVTTLQSVSSQPAEDVRGPLGLTLLSAPSEPLVDFVFIHGLGGGSRKTWSKSSEPYHFWPKEWLPRDPDFKHVRIHTFGYNANWSERKESCLHIRDFAKSLLGDIHDSPGIGQDDTPIVLIGHSMGGLVLKKAYTLARQDDSFRRLALRMHTAFFLATPHRGAESATLLKNLLRVSHDARPYLADLERDSEAIQAINEEFRHYADGLRLCSFYETLTTNIGVSNVMIVDKGSATLGYPRERTALLNANHRGICKYDQPSDSNFTTVRNAFVATINAILKEISVAKQELYRGQIRCMEAFLGVFEGPEDDLMAVQEAQTSGSCEWFTMGKSFETWQDADSTSSRVLWLSGNPAVGKSILAGHVIRCLEDLNFDCSYHFFKYRNESRSTVSGFLRSIAYQMALTNTRVREQILAMQEDGVRFDQDDERAIWRKVFVSGIFRAEFHQTQYWVLDALDECRNYDVLFSMLSKLDSHTRIRVLITSRRTPELEKSFASLGNAVVSERVSTADTLGDIKLYVDDKAIALPVESPKRRQELATRILNKSAGCFLWVRLVIAELQQVWSEEEMEAVLEEMPQEMEPLYQRTLEMMSKGTRGKALAKAILTWTICARRPLSVEELRCALKLDIKETVPALDKSIASICGHLVYVDHNTRVQIIHQTARDYLLKEDIDSEFTVSGADGNFRLARTCLQYLNGDEMRAPRSRKHANMPRTSKRSSFVDYACKMFSSHLDNARAENDELLLALKTFLQGNVLSWIEYVAQSGDLHYLTRTAKNLREYLKRRAKHRSPLGKQVQVVDRWVTDLIRISAKFNKSLLRCPASIFWMIPPLCPQNAVIWELFASHTRGLSVVGLSTDTWDDRISCINYHTDRASAVACGPKHFAVGLSNGSIVLYDSTSCQELRSLDHSEPLRLLEFSQVSDLLASSGGEHVRVWDAAMGKLLWKFSTRHTPLTLAYTADDSALSIATTDDDILSWDLSNGTVQHESRWHDVVASRRASSEQAPSHHPGRVPSAAAFSPEQSLLAIVYRGDQIMLCECDSGRYYGHCGREGKNKPGESPVYYPVVQVLFNPDPQISLLAAAYGDGDLAIFDPWDLELRQLVDANAQSLAFTPNGRTLVTGSAFGTIQIFDVGSSSKDVLTLLYYITGIDLDIYGMACSNDNTRFLDIRGSQCVIWEPAVLIRKDAGEDHSDWSSQAAPPAQMIAMGEPDRVAAITCIFCHSSGQYVFCGKDDGSVSVYNTDSGNQTALLYRHASGSVVSLLSYGGERKVIVSTDEADRLLIHKLCNDELHGWSVVEPILELRLPCAATAMLLNPENDLLLITSRYDSALWSITGQQVQSRAHSLTRDREWTTHPADRSRLLLIEDGIARIFQWHDLKELAPSAGLSLTSQHRHRTAHKGRVVIDGERQLFAEVFSSPKTAHFVYWPVSRLEANTDPLEIPPEAETLDLRTEVQHLIGVSGRRLVVLDADFWVCSIDGAAAPEGGAPAYSRHFFIPQDWPGPNERHFNCQITANDDLIFVKGGEIAVIKRGFEFEQRVLVS